MKVHKEKSPKFWQSGKGKTKSEWVLRIQQQSLLKENGCIEWQQGTNKWGYGTVGVWGKSKLVHRFLMELVLCRSLEKDELVCHTCDNPPCVNINHLFIGTNLENQEDCIRKGRMRKALNGGELAGNSKLKNSDIPEIRKMLFAGILHKEIAVKFNVSRQTIGLINTKKTWIVVPHE